MGVLTYVGRLSIEEAFPILAAAKGQLRAMATVMLPDVASRLAGALKMSVTIAVPGVVGDITAKIQALTSLIASLPNLSLTPPSGAISAVGTIVLQLKLIKEALDAALSWGVYPGSVHVFVYNGRADEMGSTIAAAVAGGMLGGVRANANVLAPIIVVETSDVVAVASVRAVLRT